MALYGTFRAAGISPSLRLLELYPLFCRSQDVPLPLLFLKFSRTTSLFTEELLVKIPQSSRFAFFWFGQYTHHKSSDQSDDPPLRTHSLWTLFHYGFFKACYFFRPSPDDLFPSLPLYGVTKYSSLKYIFV